jgi:hypothetical protein
MPITGTTIMEPDSISNPNEILKFLNEQDKENTNFGEYLKENNIGYYIDFSRNHDSSWYELTHLKDLKVQIDKNYDKESFLELLSYLYEHIDDKNFDPERDIRYFFAMEVRRDDSYWDNDIHPEDIYTLGSYFKEFKEEYNNKK